MTTVTVDQVPEEARIAADDPRLYEVWAKIAAKSISEGQEDQYNIIADRINAPSLEKLRDCGVLNGHTHHRIYLYFEFDTDSVDKNENFTAEDVRKAIHETLDLQDDQIVQRSNVEYARIDWNQ